MTPPSVLDLIGNTPMVEICRLNPNPRVKILAKLEYLNPGGSIKDRAALSMIEAGEKSGELTKEKTVIEATSGNTGIGLAMVCAVKGYKLLLAMSETASIERQKILRGRGAEILLTPGHLSTDGAIEEVYRLARENPDKYFMTDQFNNPANWQAHYHTTAEEIWSQTNGEVNAVVATLGTSGTAMGLARRLKEYDPEIRILGVEPYRGHKIQGLKNMKESYRPDIYDKSLLDAAINVDDDDAFEMTRRLAREEGLFVGMSSGAAMAIAARTASEMTSGTLVVILPDSGERYLSTPLFDVQENVELRLFNTLNRRKERFTPLAPGKVSVYSCGPTAHTHTHVSEGRRFIFSDLLVRYLRFRDYRVTHVMNITDLDDNTIRGADETGETLEKFTGQMIEAFRADLEVLGIEPADHYPKTSEHLQEMVDLAERLARKGVAYEKFRSLYFDISKLNSYGELSGIDLEKIKIGATVDLENYEKDNPRDFTLLKRSTLPELKRGIFIKTRWGNVRPSWHLQCAAMSMKYLGEQLDIHAAGRELVFPHHENESAIAGALTGKPLARYWLHCDRVLVDGRKVDEKGNGLTIRTLIENGWTGREIRYWLLASHYSKAIRFSKARLIQARRALRRLDACVFGLSALKDGKPYGELPQLLYDFRSGFISAMDDDLNISAAMASIFRNIRKVNILLRKRALDPNGAEQVLEVFRSINGVLNIFDFAPASADRDLQELMNARAKARAEKNWTEADRIRDQLLAMGCVVRDGKIS